MMTRTPHREGGFALLVALLVSSVVLAVGLSMSTITLKQYIFSGIGEDSEIAFYAADAGLECALFRDTVDGGDMFNIGNDLTDIPCMGASNPVTITGSPNNGDTKVNSREKQTFEINWGTNPTVCAKVEVTKFNSPSSDVAIPGETLPCPAGSTCTRIESRGYNRSCTEVNAVSPTTPNLRLVERALKASY